ncbi:J domain-containing protein [Hirschfeldia incana]|nr:J domain-containing protein [Hirschfeldia incana]
MEKEDLYAVMDLNNECSQGDLRLSYKNLALKWHPDRFSGENEKDKANTKFQSIQKAYSVLSDSNKRMLYDIGAYDSDDDETGMADFINEMVTLMAQTQSTGDETLEEFEKLFEELLMDDVNQFKTPSSFPYAPFSGTLYGDDLSNDDTPNKVNLDSYCCISSGEVSGPSASSRVGNRRSTK